MLCKRGAVRQYTLDFCDICIESGAVETVGKTLLHMGSRDAHRFFFVTEIYQCCHWILVEPLVLKSPFQYNNKALELLWSG